MKPEQARQFGLEARRALSARQRASASHVICRRIARTPSFRNAGTIAVYLALHDEVDLTAIISHALFVGKRVCVPLIEKANGMHFYRLDEHVSLERHKFGMLQPRRLSRRNSAFVPRARIDLVCAPMSAFDKKNNRTGTGGGYYDRYMANRKRFPRPAFFGVAFACQGVDIIEKAPWDIAVDRVVSERFVQQRARHRG